MQQMCSSPSIILSFKGFFVNIRLAFAVILPAAFSVCALAQAQQAQATLSPYPQKETTPFGSNPYASGGTYNSRRTSPWAQPPGMGLKGSSGLAQPGHLTPGLTAGSHLGSSRSLGGCSNSSSSLTSPMTRSTMARSGSLKGYSGFGGGSARGPTYPGLSGCGSSAGLGTKSLSSAGQGTKSSSSAGLGTKSSKYQPGK
ncbi:MAG: hypothetical protein JOY51_02935 [Nevskia sp.]|nr:hypothetical protein [Nevskia sp.]